MTMRLQILLESLKQEFRPKGNRRSTIERCSDIHATNLLSNPKNVKEALAYEYWFICKKSLANLQGTRCGI